MPEIKTSKSRGGIISEYILFTILLCALSLRVTFVQSTENVELNLVSSFENIFEIFINAVLFICILFWFILFLFSKNPEYKRTRLEIGLIVFTIAAIISTIFASDKRAAINTSISMLLPILISILLIQILDSRFQIILTLSVIACLGVISAYQCSEQFFVSNKAIIEQYKSAPEEILIPLGIRPGSFNHMLLEHRIMSQDVRSFFTTGNSAGSFAILSAAAALCLFFYNYKNNKKVLISACIFVFIIFGLFLTHSKGAIAASILTAVMVLAYFRFEEQIKRNKKSILFLCMFGFLSLTGIILAYGCKNGRLPGNSMLVRWQYWSASAKMYAEHFLTGVGPGNFPIFYSHYKVPESLETVTDPHNFLLNILTQFGPLGLAGFLLIIFLPLVKIIFTGNENNLQEKTVFKQFALVLTFIISLALLFVRPVFLRLTPAADYSIIMIYSIFIFYLAAPIIFLVAFGLLTFNLTNEDLFPVKIICVLLFCAIAGFLAHNLIDFAFFEQGVYLAFWFIMAVLISLNFKNKISLIFNKFSKLFLIALLILVSLLMVKIYFYPVTNNILNIRKALVLADNKNFEQAHACLEKAALTDKFNPVAPSLNGRLYVNQYLITNSSDTNYLLKARDKFETAIERSKADFKNYSRLTDVYLLLADVAENNSKTMWLQKAFDAASTAVKLYPGSSELHIDLAQIAEKVGNNNAAIENYKSAVEIEDAYRKQFEMMYPGQKVFSRLDEQAYNFAKERIEYLSKSKK